MSANGLPDEVKRFVVQQLAMFETPSEVARSVKDEFGIEVSRQAVEAYDPGKRAGSALSQEFRELFAATRETFIADTASIGVTHKVVRLRTLARLIEKAEGRGNAVLVASLLEQVAKECGDAFTNKRQVEATGKDGAPLLDGGITVQFIRPAPVPDAG
ncbi:DUF2280 domain-containing protein [Methylorubrum populi]|uniref:DUF2280 domain-containing protein n=1 Tax=Methylorubrum rhodesianum TaxID=29427 RepID=UPI00190E0612|nr:DUF2280 domain-containing protein [Methylorubrum rhodesianum]MBK3406286.1 DUF2280 domain-containing protein [Methylorubrum rhodesianum]MBY0143220.1 DUF2280 domain-containing protein [Methylorubrum populi]